MGITVAVTRAALNTSTGTQNFTTTDCGGLTPKAAKFFLTKGVTDGAVANNGAICIGATDGTRQWAFGIQSQDAAATSATDRFSESDHCVAIQDVAGAIEGSAAFSAWITNGITINIDDAFPAGYLLTVVFYCGSDLSAYAGNSALGNAIDFEANITAVGFQPDIVFAAFINQTSMDIASTQGILAFGVARETGGTVTQRCMAIRNADAQASVTIGSRFSALYGIMSIGGAGTLAWGGEFANFDSQGFSVFTRIGAGGNLFFGYLALKFGGVASAWVGTVASPTSTGNASVTAPGFKPQFVMRGLSMMPAVDTSYSDDNANSFGVGVITANAQFCNSLWDDDAAADSNSECISDNIPVNIQNGVDGTGLAASFVSLDPTGWTVNYSDVETVAKQSWAVAIGEVSTRFYLPSSGAAGASPGFDAAWEETGSTDRLKMVTTKITSAMTDKSITTLITAGDALVRQYVSDGLAVQTIGSYIKLYARAFETLATEDAVSRIVLKVVSADGSTVRGTLLAFGDFSTGAEWNTSLRNKAFADGDIPSSVLTQSGDRLVLEIGFNHAAVISSAAINFGDDSATDLAQDETATAANNPWLEIGQTLTFGAGGRTTKNTDPQRLGEFVGMSQRMNVP